VKLLNLLDVSDANAQAALDLDLGALRSDDPSRCRNVGEAAFVAGRTAILAPSATGHGSILAVFSERLNNGSTVQPGEYELWEPNEPPVAPTP
jgi:hypothetical protein